MPSIRIVTSTQARHQDTGGGGMVADGSMTGNEALAAPLSVLGLSIRASNALLNNGFSTLGDVWQRRSANSCGNYLASASAP